MDENNTNNTTTTIDDAANEKALKKEKREQKLEKRAIRRLRCLLVRVWFLKNVFTITVMLIVVLMAATLTGLIPENLPILATFSYSIRDSLQTFLELGDDEFFTTFGSITGVFTLLWSIGFASSKMKAVSYYMLDRNKMLKAILSNSKLSLDNKARIVNIEKRIGVDLDGDKLVGDKPALIDPNTNIISDIVQTWHELNTIMNIDDETLKKTINDTKYKPPVEMQESEETAESEEKPEVSDEVEVVTEVIKEDEVPEVIVKKPARMFKSNKF